MNERIQRLKAAGIHSLAERAALLGAPPPEQTPKQTSPLEDA